MHKDRSARALCPFHVLCGAWCMIIVDRMCNNNTREYQTACDASSTQDRDPSLLYGRQQLLPLGAQKPRKSSQGDNALQAELSCSQVRLRMLLLQNLPSCSRPNCRRRIGTGSLRRRPPQTQQQQRTAASACGPSGPNSSRLPPGPRLLPCAPCTYCPELRPYLTWILLG